jgi:hypothetical protein
LRGLDCTAVRADLVGNGSERFGRSPSEVDTGAFAGEGAGAAPPIGHPAP